MRNAHIYRCLLDKEQVTERDIHMNMYKKFKWWIKWNSKWKSASLLTSSPLFAYKSKLKQVLNGKTFFSDPTKRTREKEKESITDWELRTEDGWAKGLGENKMTTHSKCFMSYALDAIFYASRIQFVTLQNYAIRLWNKIQALIQKHINTSSTTLGFHLNHCEQMF